MSMSMLTLLVENKANFGAQGCSSGARVLSLLLAAAHKIHAFVVGVKTSVFQAQPFNEYNLQTFVRSSSLLFCARRAKAH